MKRNLVERVFICVLSIVMLIEQTGIVTAYPYQPSDSFTQPIDLEAYGYDFEPTQWAETSQETTTAIAEETVAAPTEIATGTPTDLTPTDTPSPEPTLELPTETTPTETPPELPTETFTEAPTEFPTDALTETITPTAESTPTASPSSTLSLESKLSQNDFELKPRLARRFFATNRPNELLIDFPEWVKAETDLKAEVVIHLPEGIQPEDAALTEKAADNTLHLNLDEKAEKVPLVSMDNRLGKSAIKVEIIENGKVVTSSEFEFEFAEAYAIGPEGGKAEGFGGSLTVDVPKGTFNEDTTIWMKPSNPDKQFAYYLLSEPFALFVDEISTQADLHQFNQSLTISYAYGADLEPYEDQLKLFYYDEQVSGWVMLASWADTEANVLYALTNHFTDLAVDAQSFQSARLPKLDSFQSSQFTGAAVYNFPIVLPEGPGGFEPLSLTLSYNSQSVDGATAMQQADWAGMGWSLDTGRITRNMLGTDDYVQDDTFSLTIGDFSAPLVPGADGYYHTQPESYWRIQYDSTNDKWTAWDKAGTKYTFGDSDYTRIKYPRVDWTWCDHNFTWDKGYATYEWAVSSITSLFNQTYTFQYLREGKPYNPHCLGDYALDYFIAMYPKAMIYPNGQYAVIFDIEARTDYENSWNGVTERRQFQRYRLNGVRIVHKKPEATSLDINSGTTYDNVYLYDLTYATSGQVFPGVHWSNDANNKNSTLASIIEVGYLANGNGIGLPTTTFTYADSMHLTKIENGYGGSAEFAYESMPYHPGDTGRSGIFSEEISCTQRNADGWQDQTNYTGGQPGGTYCYNGIPSGYMFLVGGNPAGGPYYISGKFGRIVRHIARQRVRPGNAYRLDMYYTHKATGARAQIGLTNTLDANDTSNTIIFPAIPSTQTSLAYTDFILSATASNIYPLIQCEYCQLNQAFLMELLTRYRVTSVKVTNGSSPQYGFANTRETTYVYDSPATNEPVAGQNCPTENFNSSTGKLCLYENRTRFLGHAKVEEHSPDGKVTITEFNQDEALLGKPKNVKVYAGAELLSQTVYTYNSGVVAPGTLPNRYGSFGFEDFKSYWIQTASETTYEYAGSAYRAKSSNYIYDAYGNVTQKTEQWGSNAVALYDKYVTITEYYPNSGTPYLVSLPARSRTYSCTAANGCTYAYNILGVTEWIYDSQTTSYTAPPTTGKLSGTRTLICYDDGTGNCLTMGNFTSQNIWKDERYGYDAWGNRTSVTTFTDMGTDTALASSGAQTTYVCYGTPGAPAGCNDDGHYTFPLWTKNALGQQTFTSFDYHLGVPVAETDSNGNVTYARYDSLGRLKRVARPGDNIDSSPSITIDYHDTVPYWTEARQKIDASTTAVVRKFYDGLGQLVQTQTIDANVNESTRDILVDYYPYTMDTDGVTRILKQSVPYDVASGSGYRSPDAAQPYTDTRLDVLGRTTRIYSPDNSMIETAYQIEGEKLKTTAWDAEGKTTLTYTDLSGRVTLVTPATGPSLEYFYTIDNDANKADTPYVQEVRYGTTRTRLHYLLDGQKVYMSDPDMGIWTYEQDALGNLKKQTDARGQTICLYYDELNRLTGKHYSANSACPTAPTMNASYAYDAGANGIGQRTSMTDTSGSTAWTYDNRGRMLSETKTITGSGTFRTEWAYNSADLIYQMRYPADNTGAIGEVVTYTYNNRSQINTVAGTNTYVAQTLYDAAGRVDLRKLGGSPTAPVLQQDYTFYSWTEELNNVGQGGRLQNMRVGSIADPASLMDLDYRYDRVGNIVQTDDYSNGSPQTQAFTYDEIDRLTVAQESGGVNGAYGTENYRYENTNGTLINSGDLGLVYGVQDVSCPGGALNKPHAVVKAGGNAYCYDENGNQTRRTTVGENLVANPGFEADENWLELRVSQYPASSYLRTAESGGLVPQNSGNSGYLISNLAYGYLESDLISISPDTQYDLYAYVRGEIDPDDSPEEGAWVIRAVFYDASGNALPSPQDHLDVSSGEPGSLNTTWQYKGGRIASPSSAAKVRIQLYDLLNSGWVAFDDVEFKQAGNSTNLANNPGFETSGNWAEVRNPDFPGTSFYHATSRTASPHSGSYAYAISNHAYGALMSSLIPANASTAYTLSAWVRGEIDEEGSEGGLWRMELCSYAADNTYLGCQTTSGGNGGATTFSNTWAQKSMQVTTPTNTANVKISLYFLTSTGWAAYDDVELVQTGTSNNLVTNPGFESASGWTESRNASFPGTSFLRTTSSPHSGSYNYIISNVSYVDLQSDLIAVASGENYDLYAFIRGEVDPDDSFGAWRLRINYYDANGTYLSYQDAAAGSPGSLIGTWRYLGGRITIPANAVGMKIRFFSYQNNGWMAFDDVSLTRVADYPVNTLTYDAENRLTGVSGALTAGYGYDGDGQRVKSTVGGVTTVYISNYFEWSGSANNKKQYYYAGSARIAERSGSSTLYWLVGDHLGSTTVVADSAGNQAAVQLYMPWGQQRYSSGSLPTSFGFTGQRQEPDLGLYFYGARWYDPYLNRWTQPDSIVPSDGSVYIPLIVDYHENQFVEKSNRENRERTENPQIKPEQVPTNPLALDRYAYSLYNPINNADPSGHCVWDLCIIEGIGLAELVILVGSTALAVEMTTPGRPEAFAQSLVTLGEQVNEQATKSLEAVGQFGNRTIIGQKELLPKSGDFPYVAPKQKGNPVAVPVPGGGFRDAAGNIWRRDPSRHGGDHWDVTNPKTGKHKNVTDEGKIIKE